MFQKPVRQHMQGVVGFLVTVVFLQIYQGILQWKKFSKSVKILQNYGHLFIASLFGPPSMPTWGRAGSRICVKKLKLKKWVKQQITREEEKEGGSASTPHGGSLLLFSVSRPLILLSPACKLHGSYSQYRRCSRNYLTIQAQQISWNDQSVNPHF